MALTGAEKTRRYHERRMREIAEMPKIRCACGCGTMIPPVNTNLKPARYTHGHNPDGAATRFKKGDTEIARRGGLAMWDKRGRGGEWRVKGGYYRMSISGEEAAKHPTATRHKNGWSVARSHVVWNETHPDDLVQPGEQVHHLNLRRDDDRPVNLLKMTSLDHHRLHHEIQEPRDRDTLGRYT